MVVADALEVEDPTKAAVEQFRQSLGMEVVPSQSWQVENRRIRGKTSTEGVNWQIFPLAA